MTIYEAIKSCEEGNFTTNKSFDRTQSMHMYHHKLYYEDGANLSISNFNIYEQEWAQDGWSIKYTKEEVDQDKLKALHEANKGYMLDQGKSYEDCIIRKQEA